MSSEEPARRERVLSEAKKRVGMPYRLDPPPDGVSNIDCSLYVSVTFRDAGVSFSSGVRTAEQIRQDCDPIGFNEVKPGDLLFFEHTYEPPEGPAADGHVASHVGISLGAGTRRMWDAHQSTVTGRDGVGETDIGTPYWQEHIFEARRPRGYAGPSVDQGGQRYRVTTAGVRLRAQPGTSKPILVENLGDETIVVSLSDQTVDADGHLWRNVRTPAGQEGWVAADFLAPIGAVEPEPEPQSQPETFRLTVPGVRLRAAPGTSQQILLQDLGANSLVTSLGEPEADADGHRWLKVRTANGMVGWVAKDFLGPAVISDGGELPDDPDHLFSFAELWPYIQSAAAEFGADAQVVAAIMKQESGFRNWRVHFDGTGHGLFGLDDNGLLPDFERWSGLSIGRGETARSIPPVPQIRFAAQTIARFTEQFGNAFNAARVWHRGPGLWQDARGDNYEALVRAHIQELFG